MTFLGTALPVVQAPMAGVQGAALAVAVSGAGGLGSVPAGMLGPDALAAELRAVGGAAVNVNFFCHETPAPDAEREAAWLARLRPYYDELGVAPGGPTGPERAPFSHDAADVLEAYRPPVVSFHFGLPSEELLARVRAWKPLILGCATTVDEARWLVARGVGGVIAQGVEAGGHRGMFRTTDVAAQLGTFALVPRIVDAVDVPVLAAGGIADERGVAAAFALGASAVVAGTAYLLCPEAKTSAVHREALLGDEETVVTDVLTGRPARGIVNRAIRELGPLGAGVPAYPRASAPMSILRVAAEARGRGDFSPLWAGQHRKKTTASAADVTRSLAEGIKRPGR